MAMRTPTRRKLERRLVLALLFLAAFAALAACGDEPATTTTEPTSPSTPETEGMSTSSTVGPGSSQEEIQAALDAYVADVGRLGEKMTRAERSVAMFSAGGLPPSNPDIRSIASLAAQTAAEAWADWKDRPAAYPLQDVHTQMLVYLQMMSLSLGSL